ncbi:hydrogenase maturation protease [Marihabitans asiaticum]|uniref:Hydrogenase maturation protease n=1 Tax=Marihabitans asiaticum TaxID=415218 RepID=A0A560WG39_9MICO|nr:hydrogenase maturation protease [Marihabitans asiaticum]TWD16663.1 hydrogenase maturation protease [Marihabitans asiaticum]
MAQPAPYELLDDGFPPPTCELLVIGCGNILRGDDAAGPVLVRRLHERGVPDGVRVVDGGTAGMDVAFGMRGADRVVIVDAAATGAAPGTTYRVPADQLEEVPALSTVHSHNFRWDHALSLARWLLGPLCPSDITVYLVEVEQVEAGAELGEAVQSALEQVEKRIVAEHYPGAAPGEDRAEVPQVEITTAGNLHLPAALAGRYFANDLLLTRRVDDRLELVPVRGAVAGGLVLKQRNAAGDRSLLVSEVLGFEPISGCFDFEWDEDRRVGLIDLTPALRAGGQREGVSA